jgi:hypothetical protein
MKAFTFLFLLFQFPHIVARSSSPDWNPGFISSGVQLCVPAQPGVIQSVQNAQPLAGYSVAYQWKMSTDSQALQPGFIGWLTISGATQASYTPGLITQTTYFIRQARLRKCRISPDSLFSNICTIVVSPPFGKVVPAGSTNICAGDSVLLTAIHPIGAAITWNNGSTGSAIYVKVSGLYSFQFTGQNGCNGVSANIQNVTIGSLITDLNLNGITNDIDFLLFIGKFNQFCSNCPEDFNGDGIVDNYDFLVFSSDYNRSCISPPLAGN